MIKMRKKQENIKKKKNATFNKTCIYFLCPEPTVKVLKTR